MNEPNTLSSTLSSTLSVPFFSDPDRLEKFRAIALTWVHTKFVPHAAMRGVGVDCVHLAARIYQECGLFADYGFPAYTMDGGRHLQRSLVTDWLDSHPSFQKLHYDSPTFGLSQLLDAIAPGDLICFNIVRVPHHCGLFYMHSGRMFIHAMHRYGVCFGNLQDPTYRTNVTAIYRPVSPSVPSPEVSDV